MYYCMTINQLAIVNKDQMSCNNKKHLFWNHLQNLSPLPKRHKVPDNTSTSIVFVMHVVRMISVTGLKLHFFKSWADKMNYLSSVPGNNFHLIFGNYSYEYSVLFKQRDVR